MRRRGGGRCRHVAAGAGGRAGPAGPGGSGGGSGAGAGRPRGLVRVGGGLRARALGRGRAGGAARGHRAAVLGRHRRRGRRAAHRRHSAAGRAPGTAPGQARWKTCSLRSRNLPSAFAMKFRCVESSWGGLTRWPVQEQFSSGGVLWFTDLTVPDSTWILPVSLGLVNLLVVEIFASQRKMPVSQFQKLVTNFFRVVSVVMIPIAATVPSSMALYWLSSSLVGLCHNLLLRSPAFRRLCRIPRTRSDSDTPYRDIMAALATRYSFSKQPH
ncbi:translation initiation factor IF-2 isoform X5 [Cinclus cinclus]|uniref:translation initiation factor IF-2 isoform X5 n=1 Tax=Cinclus cinclus TaxID=127875 RepID=UPI002E0FE63E